LLQFNYAGKALACHKKEFSQFKPCRPFQTDLLIGNCSVTSLCPYNIYSGPFLLERYKQELSTLEGFESGTWGRFRTARDQNVIFIAHNF
jgi:hypothetical protein